MMEKHVESHMDHGFSKEQWDFIFAKYADKTAFFIDTFELPEDLGTVTNELYGPSAGDPPVPDADVIWGKRGDRKWNSRLVLQPKRPTRFIRIIAGPHKDLCTRCEGKGILPASPFTWYAHGPSEVACEAEGCKGGVLKEYDCILYTAYGVPSLDSKQSPKEPGDIELQIAEVIKLKDEHPIGSGFQDDKLVALYKQLDEANEFWKDHALSAPLSFWPCADCGAPRMGDAVYDPPEPDTDGRCQTCGTL